MKVRAIFGPPGTGKTRALVGIAKHEAGANAARGVLYLSYTKAAAEEAVSRVRDTAIKPSTLHSFAFNALGMNRAGVVDKKKLAEFGKATGIPFMGSEKGSDEPQEGDEYATVLQFAHNRIIPHMEAWDRFGRPGTAVRFENFVTSYEEWKKTFGYMDFDDMLSVFAASPISSRAAEVVILDEAQDCTPLQWQAFIRICENAKRVYVAGDDDQAIYEWSGANPHGMVDFAEEHDGEVKILDQSYRVPRGAFDLSQKLIRSVIKRVDKVFNPRDHAGSVKAYGDIWDIDLNHFEKHGGMILLRDRFRMKEVEREFNRLMLPYDVLGGISPWTSKTADELRAGRDPDIPPWWREFYAQADLTRPVRVQLSTIHQAKGRESENVILDLQCTTRVLANIGLDRDAEKRVWYVGLTRTANTLAICGENPVVEV